MEQLLANISGSVRRATLRGRDYLIAPVTMIVPGVLEGSQGPLYYPPEELARNVQAWNGMPITLGHPQADNENVSARSPEVADRQQLGVVYHARADGKLAAEAWFDEADTLRLAPAVAAALQNGKRIELSTGLFTDNEPAGEGASHNGKPYTHVARNYRPDHLAILPDSVGACSINDGCGVNVNEEKSSIFERLKRFIDQLAANTLTTNPYPNEHSARLTSPKGYIRVRRQNDKFGPGIHAIFGVKKDGKTELQAIRFDKKKFTAAQARKWLTDHKHKPLEFEAAKKTTSNRGELQMTDEERKTIVDGLIANVSCWEESDRDELTELSDNQLAKLKQQADEEKKREAAAEAVKADWIDAAGVTHTWNEDKKAWEPKPKESVANEGGNGESALTEEQEQDLAFARQVRQERRDEAIAKITANEANKLTDEQLAAMDLATLQAVAESLPAKRPAANYAGAAAPASRIGGPAEDKLAPFGLPGDPGYLDEEDD